ncbi:ribosome biogenesis GTPase Der [Gemmata sp. JC717]|uniref:ribosome biogenesis GTPase Der n=1 Tax=Gemmata algarum TaxID=2975278 RepID=UPI0021BA69AC|nr:ribosome biogenesis GTPase Der [Gemmata algarum]MDY3556498.1 ribosome biogenesis GTPase Der [Gemmata algarum]
MALPLVAIVGRPNVGKSSLFNWLAGRRISIVDPTAGVTRDRVSTVVEYGGRVWDLMDTGGIGIVDVDDLSADVERQIQFAIESAAVVVFMVDIREGIVPLDEDVAARLRTINKPVILVANKADTAKLGEQAGEFNRLGYGEPLCVSADQKLGKDELFEAIVARLPPDTGEAAPAEPALMLAIVGRRNAGKSTFINSLAGGERVIVSEIPGTTRDSVDVRIERDGKSYVAIDTAGVRKTAKMGTNIEFYSNHRAQRSVRRADVVMHFFDARHRVSRVDKQLAEYVVEENKPAIFVVNKWDLVKDGMTTEEMAEYMRKMFPMLDHVPIAFITAKDGKNVLRVLQLAVQLHKQAAVRVGTGDLNRVIRAAMEASPPPMAGSKTPKVFYATQIGINPPTIVLFTNGPELFEQTYVRYLTKTLRDTFPFPEVAIKVVLRAKGEGGRRAADEEPVAEMSDADEEVPIVRAPRPAPPEPVEESEPEPAPRPRKKSRGSETWDF